MNKVGGGLLHVCGNRIKRLQLFVQYTAKQHLSQGSMARRVGVVPVKILVEEKHWKFIFSKADPDQRFAFFTNTYTFMYEIDKNMSD